MQDSSIQPFGFPTQQSKPSLFGKRFLIADKQTDFAQLIAMALQQAGGKTTLVASGWEALQSLRATRHDLALLEVTIPHGLGTDICLQIKKDSQLHLPVILMSKGMKEIQGTQILQESFRADDFLLKPFSPQFLLEKIHSLFKNAVQPQPKGENPNAVDMDEILTFPDDPFKPQAIRHLNQQDYNFFRHDPRVPLNIQVDYSNADVFFSSPTMNISKGGIFIRTDHPLPIGRIVKLEFTPPDHDDKIRGLGRVVWTLPFGGDRPAGMGVRFKDFSEDDLRLIYAYVRRLRELVR